MHTLFAMNTAIFLVLAFILTACATSGTDMQAECEAQYRKFPEIYQCTYDNIAKRNSSILKNARAKLYLLRGEQLAQEVNDGKITSLDAKVAWQSLFVQLKTANDNEIASALDSQVRVLETMRATTPIITPNRQVNCTSRNVGGTVQTNCN